MKRLSHRTLQRLLLMILMLMGLLVLRLPAHAAPPSASIGTIELLTFRST